MRDLLPIFTHWGRLRLAFIFLLVGTVSALRAASPNVGVAVLHSTSWSPNAPAREGAGEFEVLLCVAALQRNYTVAGLISVGDHNGSRACGGEDALRRATLSGLLVVKLAPHGEVASAPGALFIDGGKLDERLATELLKKYLALFGAPPGAVNPERPTASELAAIRAHVQLFQNAFADDAHSRDAGTLTNASTKTGLNASVRS